jgi:DNA-binding SARP family transcriptional activator
MAPEPVGGPKTPRLFASKTRIPLPPPHFLSRPRLLATLRAGLERKLTVVIAPAGFGKTTLVAELAREVGSAAAWLTLDPSDHDLSIFAYYLVDAIAQVRPGFGSATRDWLAATPAPAAQIEELAALLIGELDDLGGDGLVLFLDDFHEVSDSESITRLVDLIVRYLPPHIRVVLSARRPPALTTTRLLVQQQISGVGTDDLRFNLAETETWLAGRPVPADPAAGRQLVEITEGWVTGMILQAAVTVPAQPGATSEQLYAYLSSEVLERQPPAIQEFLLRAAILTHLTVAVCAAVLEVEDAASTLRWIHDQQLFLTAVGGRDAPHYRLHQLFREFLAARLRATDPPEFARLHHRAAAYFERHGDPGQAMGHLFAVQAWDTAAALAGRVGAGEIGAGRVERVERWLASFPEAERLARPALLLLETRVLTAQAQYVKAGELLARAERLFQEAGDRPGLAEVLALRSRLAAARSDGRQMVEFARQALAIREATAPVRAQAQHAAAVGYALIGEGARSDAAFATARDAYAALGDLQGTATLSSDWGYLLLMRDERGPAAEQLERAREYARQAHNVRLQAGVLSNLAAVQQVRGELELAETNMLAALDIARSLHWRRLEAETLLRLADNTLEMTGPPAAQPLYEEASEVGRRAAPAVVVGALAGQARCARRLGRYPEAIRLAQQGLDTARAGEMPFETALCRLELGAATLVHSPEDALPLLRDAEQTLVGLGRKREATRAAAILATVLFATGDFTGADAALDRAATAGEARGTTPYLTPELATIHGLPLLRRAGGEEGRYAALFAAVVRYLEAEHEAEPGGPGESGIQIVRGRPRLLEVYGLGQATVYCDGVLLARPDWQSATAKELFFYFIEHPEGLRKEVIQAALWPDQTLSRANDNFHTSLKRLRKAVGMEIVKIEEAVYRLNPTLAIWHDGAEALALIEQAKAVPDLDAARRNFTAAAALLKGPFAEEFYRDWAGARRQFWQTRTREVLMWLADDATRTGDFTAAVTWGQRLLAIDPLDESAHGLLMHIYAAAGSPAKLSQQYHELCRILQYELGGTPSPEITALYKRLLNTDPGQARFPAR